MLSTDANYDVIIQISCDNDNDNANIFISVHLSQGMILNYVHVHYANFAFNNSNENKLCARTLCKLCINNSNEFN